MITTTTQVLNHEEITISPLPVLAGGYRHGVRLKPLNIDNISIEALARAGIVFSGKAPTLLTWARKEGVYAL